MCYARLHNRCKAAQTRKLRLFSLSLVVLAFLTGLIDLGVNPALTRSSAKLRAEDMSQPPKVQDMTSPRRALYERIARTK